MKKFKFALLAAIAVLPLLQSCNKEVESVYWLIASVQPLESNDFYIKLDNGKKAYPGDRNRIGAYEAKEGQRAIVYYQRQDKLVEGYDYNFKLYGLEDILTKAPRTITTEEELKTIGDDPIDIQPMGLSGGYLDIQFGAYIASGSKHELNLIRNLVNPEEADADADAEGYTLVEFRHNANGSLASNNYQPGYVSFLLGDLDPAVTGSKGLCIRVRTISHDFEEISYIKVEPTKYDK